MDPRKAPRSVQFKVGIFSVLALLLVGAATVMVNDKPNWWRPCQLVFINVEDATGLKTKSPIRSLGLQIGYLRSVQLKDNKVRLGICITADVEVIPTTRAYIRGEGFLGDKFVELKPLKYVGPKLDTLDEAAPGVEPSEPAPAESPKEPDAKVATPESHVLRVPAWKRIFDWLIPSASAAEEPKKSKEVPVGGGGQDVQELVNQVNGLVGEMTTLTQSLKQAINPQDLRATMQQLNRTLENASRTLSPEGNLTTTAQRTLAKLEDAIEQMRDVAIRINRGEGSVGMILSDRVYADELRDLLKNANRLLTRVGGVRFLVDVGAASLNAYDGSRGWFQLSIWPKPDRYYRLGLSVDPRGLRTETTTTTTSGATSTEVNTVSVQKSGMLFTAMLGKVYRRRLDLSLGLLHGDGTVAMGINLGPKGQEEKLQLFGDFYARSGTNSVDARVGATFNPFEGLYVTGGLESVRKVGGLTSYFVGAGVSFDDEDIKMLFVLR